MNDTSDSNLSINEIFSLVYENKIVCIAVLLFSILIAYSFNYIKKKEYYYNIKLEGPTTYYPKINKSVILKDLNNNNIIENSEINSLITDLLKLSGPIYDLEISQDEKVYSTTTINLKSTKEINIKNFIADLNQAYHKFASERIIAMIVYSEKIIDATKNQELLKSSEKLDNQILETKLEVLKKTAGILDQYKNLNFYYSFNGWEIKSNNLRGIEIIFAGIFLSIFLNFIILFFISSKKNAS